MVLQRFVINQPSKQDSSVAKLKLNFAVEWNIVETEILLILHPKRTGVKYPYNTSLVIEWLWSSDCADCLFPGVLYE